MLSLVSDDYASDGDGDGDGDDERPAPALASKVSFSAAPPAPAPAAKQPKSATSSSLRLPPPVTAGSSSASRLFSSLPAPSSKKRVIPIAVNNPLLRPDADDDDDDDFTPQPKRSATSAPPPPPPAPSTTSRSSLCSFLPPPKASSSGPSKPKAQPPPPPPPKPSIPDPPSTLSQPFENDSSDDDNSPASPLPHNLFGLPASNASGGPSVTTAHHVSAYPLTAAPSASSEDIQQPYYPDASESFSYDQAATGAEWYDPSAVDPAYAAQYYSQTVSSGASSSHSATEHPPELLRELEKQKRRGAALPSGLLPDGAKVVDINQDHIRDQINAAKYGPQSQAPPPSSRGKPSKTQRRKHQITYLAWEIQQKEGELAEKRAQSRLTKSQTWGKYGW